MRKLDDKTPVYYSVLQLIHETWAFHKAALTEEELMRAFDIRPDYDMNELLWIMIERGELEYNCPLFRDTKQDEPLYTCPTGIKHGQLELEGMAA